MTKDSSDDPLATGGAFGVLSEVQGERQRSFVDRQLGDYRIVSLIAEGGMGRVYRAHRADGSFERDVAIKVSAGATLSSELRSRFVQEQGVLASLNHPNISQLYDAQVSDEGWPYFVMEYVDGESIVSYCEDNALDDRARIHLLIDVIDAVAYAHSRLVVHRDIKPANVLVNSEGQAKLVDFGIAKLLEPDAQLTHGAPLTPRYASPEQLLGQPITVASDIAQLGLLIYEVLVGEPLNPTETLADAIQRAADGRSLRVTLDHAASLPREILPIVEQCLRADPDDRYRDANSLKADLEAYLEGYPVRAVGQSAGYRFRKLLARNLPTTVTAVLAFVAIVSGVAWYTWQLGVARDDAERQAAAAKLEADKSEQISNFLVELFGAEDPARARGEQVTVQNVLESGLAKIRSDLDGQESLQADLLMTLGSVYRELDQFDKAGPLLEEAVELHRRIGSEDPTALSKAMLEHARYVGKQSDLDAMVVAFEDALATARTTNTEKGRKIEASILNSLGIALSRRNDFERSETIYKAAIDMQTSIHGADHTETSVPLANYAILLMKLGRDEEALPLLESAYAIAVEELGPYHPWIAPRAINLGTVYKRLGRLSEAEELLRVALQQDKHIFGDEHQYVASSLQNLGMFVFQNRDEAEGIRILEQGLLIEEKALGDDHIYTNQTRTLLANYYNTVGRYEESEALLDRARVRLEAALDGDHAYLADMNWYFGDLYLGTDRPQQAVGVLEVAVGMIERLYGKESGRMAGMLTRLATAYSNVGRHQDAYDTYARVVRIFEAAGGAKDYHYEDLDRLKQAAEGDDDGNDSGAG